jgi:hypothetical protein
MGREIMLDTKTTSELIDELAKRYDELIVIRPKASNVVGSDTKLNVFCKTKVEDGGYDIMQAVELLHDAQVGLLKDCLVKTDEE